MLRFLVKVLISALIIAGASELAKRVSLLGAILASLPLTSILAMIWLYLDTGDVHKVSALSIGIFWAVLPSLIFFIALPALLRTGLRFPPALALACLLMFAAYGAYALVLRKLGIAL